MTEYLERQLRTKALEYCKECLTFGYNPIAFKQMVAEDGIVRAIKRLLHKPKPSEGFETLWSNERLDLSMEALILENNEFQIFFDSDELKQARAWLKKYEYPVKE